METSMKKQSGFTLIELLIVIALIGILSAIGIPAYTGYQAKARYNAAKTNHANAVSYITAEISKCNDRATPISFVNKGGTKVSIAACPISDVSIALQYFSPYIRDKFTNPYFPSATDITFWVPSKDIGGKTWGYMTFSNTMNSAGNLSIGFSVDSGIGNIDGDKTKAGELLSTQISISD